MKIAANGLQIEVDIQGPADGQPLLLIMGLGMQLVAWPPELVADLAARGLRVIRHDNRDTGLSQGFDAAGMPNLAAAILRHTLRLPPSGHAYTIADMADDALGVLDALGVARAHVCGASMGGMIAQHLAAKHPDRVRSLTLLMTTSGARKLPQPRAGVRMTMLGRPWGGDEDASVAYLERLLAVIGSPGFRPDPVALRQRILATVRRAWRPAGTARQLHAVIADGDRSALLGRIQAPTLVLHGQDDPLIPVPAAHDLAAKITGARLDIVAGMGHDLPLGLLPRLAQAIAGHALAHPGG